MSRLIVFLFAFSVALFGCSAPPHVGAPDVGTAEQAVGQVKFLLYLNASEPGSTWDERDDAAYAKVLEVRARIVASQGGDRVPQPDYPDDNAPSRGLEPLSRGYALGTVPGDQAALTPEEIQVLVNECPADTDGRTWGSTSGVRIEKPGKK